jgi:hypothetical protein
MSGISSVVVVITLLLVIVLKLIALLAQSPSLGGLATFAAL